MFEDTTDRDKDQLREVLEIDRKGRLKMIDDRTRCICGHEEDRHEISGYCVGVDCPCDSFIVDDEEREKATESMLDNLRGK